MLASGVSGDLGGPWRADPRRGVQGARGSGPRPPARAVHASRQAPQQRGGLQAGDLRRIWPYIARSAVIGTVIGALPGVGSTLAATLGYTSARARHARIARARRRQPFGEGAPEGIAATEAANSSSVGRQPDPGAEPRYPRQRRGRVPDPRRWTPSADSTPAPRSFGSVPDTVNPELVIAFGLFTTMVIANLLNWTHRRALHALGGLMIRVPRDILLPVVLLLTLTSIYVQEPQAMRSGSPSVSAFWAT
jgi:putative tricarboxylic transport membrane protein